MYRFQFLPLLVFFLGTFDAARAIHFEYPRVTTSHDDVSGLQTGWSPRPTTAPQFFPWLAKAEQGPLFVRRDVDSGLCGFLSGEADRPLDCNTNEVCAFYNLQETKNFVCCPTTASGTVEAGDCPYRSMCLQYMAPGNLHFGTGTIVNKNNILSCGMDEPYCYAMANSESAGGRTWYFFGCDMTPGLYNAAMTATSNIRFTTHGQKA